MLADNHWYEIPERWVDAVDIQMRGKASVDVLQDLIVKRSTEYGRFKKLFFRAMSNKMTLLPRQQQAIDLANEAKALGITESTYISEKLGIQRQPALRLLKRAEERLTIITYQNDEKMVPFDRQQAIYDDTRLQVTQDEIDNVLRGRWVTCLTQAENEDHCKGHARAYFGICRPCYETFTNKRYYPDGMPEWVEFLIRDNRKEQREQARQDIINRRTKRINIDDVS